MKTKIYNISKIILSLIVVINIILLSTAIIFSLREFSAILVLDILVCLVLLADFFKGFHESSNKLEYLRGIS